MTRILYIEDNDDNLYMMQLRFELLDGFELLTATDGESGCATAVAERPDLILMDLDMPVLDGWEATRRLKSNDATKQIPVIALTAHALSGSREQALAAGCDEFEPKPIDFDRLMHKIKLVLGNRTAAR
jgi:CheY-like chemotaxis protein